MSVLVVVPEVVDDADAKDGAAVVIVGAAVAVAIVVEVTKRALNSSRMEWSECSRVSFGYSSRMLYVHFRFPFNPWIISR